MLSASLLSCDAPSTEFDTPPEIAAQRPIECPLDAATDVPRAAPAGETIVIGGTEPRCQVELTRVVRLVPPDEDLGLLAGPHVARRADGVYVSDIFGENALAVWDATGRFVRKVGRSGRGPGEFASGIQPFFGANDSLYAIDNAQELSVFDSLFRFVRRTSQPDAHVPLPSWFMTVDDRRFVSPPPSSQRSFHVAELDKNCEVKALLVPVHPEQTERGYAEVERVLAYGGGDSFWIGPTFVPEQRYEMEEWSLDGQLLRRVRRDVDWFISMRAGEPLSPSSPAPTFFAMLQVDSSGYWHTVISRREYRAPLPHGVSENREQRKARMTARWEIIDPATGTLVASRAFADVDSLPLPFIAGTNTSRIIVSNDLDAHVEVVRWHVGPKSASPR